MQQKHLTRQTINKTRGEPILPNANFQTKCKARITITINLGFILIVNSKIMNNLQDVV